MFELRNSFKLLFSQTGGDRKRERVRAGETLSAVHFMLVKRITASSRLGQRPGLFNCMPKLLNAVGLCDPNVQQTKLTPKSMLRHSKCVCVCVCCGFFYSTSTLSSFVCSLKHFTAGSHLLSLALYLSLCLFEHCSFSSKWSALSAR